MKLLDEFLHQVVYRQWSFKWSFVHEVSIPVYNWIITRGRWCSLVILMLSLIELVTMVWPWEPFQDIRLPIYETTCIWWAIASGGAPSILEQVGVCWEDIPDGLPLIPWECGQSVSWDFTSCDTLAQSPHCTSGGQMACLLCLYSPSCILSCVYWTSWSVEWKYKVLYLPDWVTSTV